MYCNDIKQKDLVVILDGFYKVFYLYYNLNNNATV